MSRPASRQTLRFIFSRLTPHRLWIFPSVLFALITASMVWFQAELPRRLIDDALLKNDWNKVLLVCGGIVLVFFIDGLADFLHRICLRVATERTVRQLRSEVFDRFLVFSHAQSGRFPSSKAVTHVVSDIQVIAGGMHILADVIRDPLVIIVLLVKLFMLNWKLSIVCLVSVPLIALVGKKLGSSARRNQTRIQECMERITNHVVESVGGLKTAHSFGQTHRLRNEFREELGQTYNYLIRLARTEEAVNPTIKWIGSWVGAFVLAVGGYMVVFEGASVGTLTGFIIAAGMIPQPIRQLNHVNVRLQQVLAAGERLLKLLNEPLDALAHDQEKLLERSAPVLSSRGAGVPSLRFENVNYQYPGRGADAA
jgi:ABC-type multidrug transport system fused ATPase/permease subunit